MCPNSHSWCYKHFRDCDPVPFLHHIWNTNIVRHDIPSFGWPWNCWFMNSYIVEMMLLIWKSWCTQLALKLIPMSLALALEWYWTFLSYYGQISRKLLVEYLYIQLIFAISILFIQFLLSMSLIVKIHLKNKRKCCMHAFFSLKNWKLVMLHSKMQATLW